MNYVIKGHGAMRNVNVRLHRPTVMPDDCAEEGGHPPGYGWRENQGDYIHDVPKPKKVPRNWLSTFAAVTIVVCSVAAVLLWIHFGVAPR